MKARTVVHAITVVQTVLQVVDAKGNVTESVPLRQDIKVFSTREFALAYAAIDKARQRLARGLPAAEPAPVEPAVPVNGRGR